MRPKPSVAQLFANIAELSPMKHKGQNIHFVGIGGSGMSGIAEVLPNLGFDVSGSDIAASATTRRLKAKASKVIDRPCRREHCRRGRGGRFHGVKADNPEVIAAREARSRWCRAPRCWPS